MRYSSVAVTTMTNLSKEQLILIKGALIERSHKLAADSQFMYGSLDLQQALIQNYREVNLLIFVMKNEIAGIDENLERQNANTT
jgi:hypothetical protein